MMAELYKRGMRRYLTTGPLDASAWGRFNVPPPDGRFKIKIGDYQLQVSRLEADALIRKLEERMLDPEIMRAEGILPKIIR